MGQRVIPLTKKELKEKVLALLGLKMDFENQPEKKKLVKETDQELRRVIFQLRESGDLTSALAIESHTFIKLYAPELD